MRKQRVLFVLMAHRAAHINLLIIISIPFFFFGASNSAVELFYKYNSVQFPCVLFGSRQPQPCRAFVFIWASLTLLACLYSFVHAWLLHVHWCDPNPHTVLVSILSYFVTVGWVIDFSLFIHMYMRNSFWMRLVLQAVTRSGEKTISSRSFL